MRKVKELRIDSILSAASGYSISLRAAVSGEPIMTLTYETEAQARAAKDCLATCLAEVKETLHHQVPMAGPRIG